MYKNVNLLCSLGMSGPGPKKSALVMIRTHAQLTRSPKASPPRDETSPTILLLQLLKKITLYGKFARRNADQRTT